MFESMKVKSGIVFVLTLVASTLAEPQLGSMTDSRDGQTYRTAQIGDKTWIVENLNYKSGFCYDDNSYNCERFGRLYTWKTAQTACPEGWRLPTDDEWGELINSQKGWQNIKKTGIQLPMAGDRRADGVYHYIGESAFYWTATPDGKKFIRYKFEAGKPKHDRAPMVDGPAYSIKCVSGGSKSCSSPLMNAIRSGNVAKVDALLKKNSALVKESCYTEDDKEMTSLGNSYENISPLGMAIDKGNMKIIEMLLGYGADPNAVDESGPSDEMYSMLGRAGYKGNVRMVQLLLEKGAKVGFCDVLGIENETILLTMVERMDPKEFNLCEYGETLLDKLKKYSKVSKLLKSRGARNSDGYCRGLDEDFQRGIGIMCGD